MTVVAYSVLQLLAIRVTTFQTTWNSLTFPVEPSKDYPVSSVCRYSQQSLFHINEKQGEARWSII